MRASAEYVFEEAAGRDLHLVCVAELDQLEDGAPRHQRERAASELERVDVGAHRFEHVLEVPAAEGAPTTTMTATVTTTTTPTATAVEP